MVDTINEPDERLDLLDERDVTIGVLHREEILQPGIRLLHLQSKGELF